MNEQDIHEQLNLVEYEDDNLYDRFDLEDAINEVWYTEKDLDLAWTSFYDGKKELTEDNIANIFSGIQHIHDLRCQKLFDIFEYLVNNKIIK